MGAVRLEDPPRSLAPMEDGVEFVYNLCVRESMTMQNVSCKLSLQLLSNGTSLTVLQSLLSQKMGQIVK